MVAKTFDILFLKTPITQVKNVKLVIAMFHYTFLP
jgi:hypothetical protein